MKIVLYVNSFLPSIGGREIVVHYLAKELQNLGHRVRVVGPSGWIKFRGLRFGYPVHRWPTLKRLFNEKVRLAQLRLDIAIWGCDIIHAHSTYLSGYTASQLKQLRGTPLVITPHGEDIHMIPDMGFGLRMNPELSLKIGEAIQSAEVLTAISESIETSMIDAGCPVDKIHRIPNGIDCDRFQKVDLPDVRHWLGIEADAPIIFSVGNYHPRKGYEVLLRAMPLVLNRVPRAHLVIAGRYPDPYPPLAQLSDAPKIADRVHLTGSIPFPSAALNQGDSHKKDSDDRLAALYQNSEVYGASGIDEGSEGLSLAVLDAMAAGLPIVATRISGNMDIVKDGKTGLLVPPANHEKLAEALITLLKDSDTRAYMGRNARQFAQGYHWREIARQYVEAYKDAIQRSKCSGRKIS